jgi:hypothetical protein
MLRRPIRAGPDGLWPPHPRSEAQAAGDRRSQAAAWPQRVTSGFARIAFSREECESSGTAGPSPGFPGYGPLQGSADGWYCALIDAETIGAKVTFSQASETQSGSLQV